MMQYKWVQSAPKWICMKFDAHFQSKTAFKQLIHEKYVCMLYAKDVSLKIFSIRKK